ncbi:MAG TPA: hypothetical protein DCZ69_16050 [Syntrophobacteraceae bacterium]|jgi:hypothetical protein|nr:hypothetical protein [Syntrophobacteraceae bacterium]HBD09765.1 hypothetical protein [Syntrophobacteraceae bacterium]HBZ54483.1 hypothetical protein [Syntrophobacteraceae bacterium]
MMKPIRLMVCVCWVVAVIFPAAVLAAGADILPFPVSLGGQKAVVEKPDAVFAKIAQPVAANAELAVETKENMIIVNIFDSDANGNAKQGVQPLVVIMQGTKKSPINKTMDGKSPAPGYHIMNIVAGGATARVFFSVK